MPRKKKTIKKGSGIFFKSNSKKHIENLTKKSKKRKADGYKVYLYPAIETYWTNIENEIEKISKKWNKLSEKVNQGSQSNRIMPITGQTYTEYLEREKKKFIGPDPEDPIKPLLELKWKKKVNKFIDEKSKKFAIEMKNASTGSGITCTGVSSKKLKDTIQSYKDEASKLTKY